MPGALRLLNVAPDRVDVMFANTAPVASPQPLPEGDGEGLVEFAEGVDP